SFVMIVHDLDAPIGTGVDDLLQWLVWNIPAAARALPVGVPEGGTLPDGAPHHYVFEIYALDTMLDVPAVGASPVQTRAAVTAAMAGHVRGKGVLTGT